MRTSIRAAPRPYSYGEGGSALLRRKSSDFASEASKSRPESVGQAYRASRTSRRLSCSKDRRYNSSEVEPSYPEAMLTPTKTQGHGVFASTPTTVFAKTQGAPTPTTKALQRRRVSHGEMLGLDFPSEESKDKPDSSRRLHRRPEGPKGSEVASETINGKPERGRRIRFGECSFIESSQCPDVDTSPDLSSRHRAAFTGQPGLAREQAAAHSMAVTAVHAAARRERAVAAGRDSADARAMWQKGYLRGAQPPRDSIEWV